MRPFVGLFVLSIVVLTSMASPGASAPLAGATAAAEAPSARATAICSRGDRPETGMQGETPLADIDSGRAKSPYFCGIRIVAKIDPWGRGSNGFIKRSRTCAYLSGGGRGPNAGLAVIDMSDPAAPKAVGLLKSPGALGASETMDVIDVGDRHILVAGDYAGGLNPPGPAPLDIFDITDCANPKLITTYWWPANIHVPKITPDGMRVYGTRQFGTAGVMVLDISDLKTPRYMGDFPLILPGGRQQRCHDIEINATQTRMYCSGSVPLIEGRKEDSAPSVWDISLVGKTNLGPTGAWPPIRFIGTSDARGQGDHHIPIANINGRRYLVGANELRCSAFPRIFDISDETKLQAVGEFRLESNDRCLADPAWARANAIGAYGLHYNDVVSDAWGTAPLGMFNFMGSGLRVVDLRDPTHPREVAYYHQGMISRPAAPRPAGPPVGSGAPPRVAVEGPRLDANGNELVADTCMSHDYFIRETGQIWFGCSSGLYVAELSPGVRAFLGVPARPSPGPHRLGR